MVATPGYDLFVRISNRFFEQVQQQYPESYLMPPLFDQSALQPWTLFLSSTEDIRVKEIIFDSNHSQFRINFLFEQGAFTAASFDHLSNIPLSELMDNYYKEYLTKLNNFGQRFAEVVSSRLSSTNTPIAIQLHIKKDVAQKMYYMSLIGTTSNEAQ